MPDLPNGPHKLTVFMGADWVITNQTGSSPFFATVEFNVETASEETSHEFQREPSPTTLTVAVVAAGAVAVAGLLVYFKNAQKKFPIVS